MPVLMAFINAMRGDMKAHSERLSEVEQRLLQQRIDIQRDMVGRHEIERLSSLIQSYVSIVEQTNQRMERLADRLEKRQ